MESHYVVLSRKYRPKDLKDLIGQDAVAEALKNCIDNQRVPHAFLLHGIRGVGKTTTARIIARCLNCLGPDGETNTTSSPCGLCKSCIAIDKDQHMDVMEIDAASRTGVDDIREIIESTQYAPIMGRYKIFIIDEVHMLSKSAFNALLKTLEEPPSHVKFIFATTELNKIPETILSRCMTFNLKKVSISVIDNHITSICKKENFQIEQDAASMIAEESGGSVRDALSMLEQAMMICLKSKIITNDTIIDMLGGCNFSDALNLMNDILKARLSSALQKTESIIENGADPYFIFRCLQDIIYRLISIKVSGKSDNKDCSNVAETCSLSNLLYLWQIFIKQLPNIKNSESSDNVLKAIVIILAHTASFPSIESLSIKENKNILNDIKDKFPGVIISEIE